MSSNLNQANSGPVVSEIDPKLLARQILGALGSLKLTVFLLVLGLLLVFIATLQQSRKDIYQIKKQHFGTPVVFIEYQELLTPAWFPEYQDIGGGFLMPSGAAVLIAMLVNLICAHIARFKIQASGRTLWVGTLFLAVGVLATLVVISNGNAQGQFQEDPIIPWKTQWLVLQGLLGAAAAAGIRGGFTLDSGVRQLFSLLTGLFLGGTLVVLLAYGDRTFIGDAAMRVVWRLMQGSVAAIVCYVGAAMVFRRKGGIVLIHSGLLLLMVGELYTTYSAVEQQLFFYEGDTTTHTIDVQSVELAVISNSTEQEGTQDVVVVPASQLKVDEVVSNDVLPFDVRTVAYYPNSDLVRVRPGEQTVPSAKGLAQNVFAQPIAEYSGAGAEASRVNLASAYVEIINKESGESLGTYLVSQVLYKNDLFALDQIDIDGRKFQIGLRSRHIYKPYSVYLESTTRANYTGTEIPKTYSSTFRIVDPKNNVDELKYVSMNNPLRYNNETFYQSQYGTDASGRTYSVLQVVRNTGWMIPYVSCAMVGIGLVLHFLGIFVRFIERLTETSSGWKGYDRISWIVVVLFVLLFGMFAWRRVPEPASYLGLDLERFGQIPIAYKGRVQPLDSLARSTLRQLRKYEIPVKWDGSQGKEVAYPPTQWLADWIYGAEGSNQYRIFKIEEPQLVEGLSLPRRKSHLYSYKELRENENVARELNKTFRAARAVQRRDKTKVTNVQKKAMELESNLQLVEVLRLTLGTPDLIAPDDPMVVLSVLDESDENKNDVPLGLPGQEENSWSILSPLFAPSWLKSLSEKFGTTDANQIADKMLKEETIEQFRDAILRRQIEDMFRQVGAFGPETLTDEQLDRVIDDLLTTDSPEVARRREEAMRVIEPLVDEELKNGLADVKSRVIDSINEFVPVVDGQLNFDHVASGPAIVDLPAAWLAKDADRFNLAVDRYLGEIESLPDVEKTQLQVRSENLLSRLSPFYLATAIFIGAFVLSLLSWLCLTGAQWSERFDSFAVAFRRAAFWLIVGCFLLQSTGLVLRIIVSQRPPVTNLYSSALFIGWVGVLMGMVTEKLLGYSFGSVMSSLIGVTTYFTAFALGSEGDTFSVLQAVLDTQFWLSTHVVSITIGYAGTLVAGILGIKYLALSMFVYKDLTNLRKTLARMIYGVTCLSLIFSFVGTVLGGLWADDSWGRFWGWDPKENGALMIVLVNAILLHARWAGMIRDRGMAMVAIIGNVVTIWSWFAVNELGIGLHTYGLTEGRMYWVSMAWALHLGLVVLAFTPTRWWLSNLAANRLPAGVMGALESQARKNQQQPSPAED